MKVLLVDDEQVALNALKKRMDWMKYDYTEVYTAQDLTTARRILKEQVISLVLCDIEMAGEDGLELAEYLDKNCPSTQCIMVTCHAEFDYVRKSMKCRVYDYILKPIDYDELGEVLEQLGQEMNQKEEKQKLDILVEKVSSERDDLDTVPKQRVEVAKQYIEEHLQEKIRIEDLAELVHLNEQYFMRIFKQETGASVTEYVTERRMSLASRLLRETDKSVNFIADCVGCENYSYFTKLFKKYTGYTPRKYREIFQKSS